MERITLTVKEAAEVVGISASKMYGLVRDNKVPHILFGKRAVIPKEPFYQWVVAMAKGGC